MAAWWRWRRIARPSSSAFARPSLRVECVGRPIIQSHVCQLERTDNDHYLIDRHPDYTNAWLAGGGSGHAFKMGPILGEHVGNLVLGQPQDPALQALFGLASHKPVPADAGW